MGDAKEYSPYSSLINYQVSRIHKEYQSRKKLPKREKVTSQFQAKGAWPSNDSSCGGK